MDSVQELLKLPSEISLFEDIIKDFVDSQRESNLSTFDIKSLPGFEEIQDLLNQNIRIIDEIAVLVFSFDEPEIRLTFGKLTDTMRARLKEVTRYLLKVSNGELPEQIEGWGSVRQSAGKFHQALREELISLRY